MLAAEQSPEPATQRHTIARSPQISVEEPAHVGPGAVAGDFRSRLRRVGARDALDVVQDILGDPQQVPAHEPAGRGSRKVPEHFTILATRRKFVAKSGHLFWCGRSPAVDVTHDQSTQVDAKHP